MPGAAEHRNVLEGRRGGQGGCAGEMEEVVRRRQRQLQDVPRHRLRPVQRRLPGAGRLARAADRHRQAQKTAAGARAGGADAGAGAGGWDADAEDGRDREDPVGDHGHQVRAGGVHQVK